jgi:hypothetical protein
VTIPLIWPNVWANDVTADASNTPGKKSGKNLRTAIATVLNICGRQRGEDERLRYCEDGVPRHNPIRGFWPVDVVAHRATG